jgi:hypothetical protein
VTAKDVRGKQFLGYVLLAGIQYFRVRHDSGNLRNVPRFHRITQDNAHEQ